VAGLLDRVVKGSNDLLSFPRVTSLDHPLVDILSQGFSGDGELITSHKTLLDQESHDAYTWSHSDSAHRAYPSTQLTWNTPDGVDVLHDVLSTGLEVGQEGDPVRDLLEVVNREIDADGTSNGEEVEHGIRGSSKDHGQDHGVLESLAGHDIPRLQV
jgi:hypothetical protein